MLYESEPAMAGAGQGEEEMWMDRQVQEKVQRINIYQCLLPARHCAGCLGMLSLTASLEMSYNC